MKSSPVRLLLAVSWISFILCYQQLRPQPDDVESGRYDELRHEDPHLCTRQCRLGEKPRICYYKWHLEAYSVLGGACGLCPKVKADCFAPQCVTADGYERAILTVNRKLPGPSIQVCQGDIVVVDVANQMPGSSTTIHWHGLRQRGSPWMDGVPMVTQCPIMEGQTFRYRFEAEEFGSYFWHSHSGLQKVDGVVGSLIVREPDETNKLRHLYDLDLPSHVVLVQDWMHTPAGDRLPGMLTMERGQVPDSYLINGRGIQTNSLREFYSPHSTPWAEFVVRPGFRYRFRLIGGSCLSCPFRVSVQSHQLLVITTDDNSIEPVLVDSVVISSGERYDVVIEASQPVDPYWLLVEGLGECSRARQVAVLLYYGSPIKQPSLPPWSVVTGFGSLDPGYTLNPRNSKCLEASLFRGVCVSQLRNLDVNPPQISGTPDVRIFMPFGFHVFNKPELYETNRYNPFFVASTYTHVISTMNNVSNVLPPAPLLTQFYDIPSTQFCHESNCNPYAVCRCTNLIKVPLGSVVEFILVDTNPPTPIGLSHPFHIHGHDFYVVEQGKIKLPLLQFLLDLDLRLSKAGRTVGTFLPAKDTVTVPETGYAIVRILADNPGMWLFHCHFAFHLETGMAAIIQVGELSDFLPAPRGFPTCHEFLPPIDELGRFSSPT